MSAAETARKPSPHETRSRHSFSEKRRADRAKRGSESKTNSLQEQLDTSTFRLEVVQHTGDSVDNRVEHLVVPAQKEAKELGFSDEENELTTLDAKRDEYTQAFHEELHRLTNEIANNPHLIRQSAEYQNTKDDEVVTTTIKEGHKRQSHKLRKQAKRLNTESGKQTEADTKPAMSRFALAKERAKQRKDATLQTDALKEKVIAPSYETPNQTNQDEEIEIQDSDIEEVTAEYSRPPELSSEVVVNLEKELMGDVNKFKKTLTADLKHNNFDKATINIAEDLVSSIYGDRPSKDIKNEIAATLVILAARGLDTANQQKLLAFIEHNQPSLLPSSEMLAAAKARIGKDGLEEEKVEAIEKQSAKWNEVLDKANVTFNKAFAEASDRKYGHTAAGLARGKEDPAVQRFAEEAAAEALLNAGVSLEDTRIAGDRLRPNAPKRYLPSSETFSRAQENYAAKKAAKPAKPQTKKPGFFDRLLGKLFG